MQINKNCPQVAAIEIAMVAEHSVERAADLLLELYSTNAAFGLLCVQNIRILEDFSYFN